MRTAAGFVVLTGSLAISLLAGPQAQTSKAAKSNASQQLQSQFELAKFSGFELRQAGSVLLVHKYGIGALPGSGVAVLANSFGSNYKDGRIRHDKVSDFLQGRAEGLRNLTVGEGVYLLKIQVTDSSVILYVQACGACDPAAPHPYPVRATVTFPFGKGFLDNTPIEQIQQTIAEVFVVANYNSGTQTPQPPPPPGNETSAPPANSPVDPAREPVRIELGQTIDQVQAILGKPEKMVDLGSKKIYVYKDLKITFLDGVVSDVQ